MKIDGLIEKAGVTEIEVFICVTSRACLSGCCEEVCLYQAAVLLSGTLDV